MNKFRTGASIVADKNDIDIISISSDDTLATDNFIHANGGDDDCWTLFNDEYNSKAQSNKNKIQEKPYNLTSDISHNLS